MKNLLIKDRWNDQLEAELTEDSVVFVTVRGMQVEEIQTVKYMAFDLVEIGKLYKWLDELLDQVDH